MLVADITVGFCDGISKAVSSLSKGAVGDGRSDGRTGGFEVLVADIIVGRRDCWSTGKLYCKTIGWGAYSKLTLSNSALFVFVAAQYRLVCASFY